MPQTNMTSTPLRTHFSILRILVLPHFRLSRNTVKSLCQKTLAVISAFRLFTAFVFPSTKFSLKNHKQAKMWLKCREAEKLRVTCKFLFFLFSLVVTDFVPEVFLICDWGKLIWLMVKTTVVWVRANYKLHHSLSQ